MPADVVATLAMTGATTIVAAMATSAWLSARAATARLFHRQGHDLERIESQLDGDAAVVEQDEDTDGARQDLVGLWGRRLAALLREHPEAEADLRALIDEVRRQLPQAQQNWLQTNTVSGSGSLFASQGGNVIVHNAGPGHVEPPTSQAGEPRGDSE